MSGERVLDVSRTPTMAFGHRSILWWATAGVMVIEGMVFAFAIATLFYIRGGEYRWPPGFPPPSLIFATINTAVLLLSLIPNAVVKKAAEKFDPDRFAEPRNEHKRHRYAFTPFGGGAHKCIGMVFGQLEVKTIMHRLLRRYRLELPRPDYKPRWDYGGMPVPMDGMPIVLRPLRY